MEFLPANTHKGQYQNLYLPRPPPPPDPEPAHDIQVEQLGPLAVGDPLGSWVIESIQLHGAEARVVVVHDDQRVTFGFAAPSVDVPAGPHSHEALNIYYDAPDQVSFEILDPAGVALREALVTGVEDPGAAVAQWIEEARPLRP